MAARPAVARHGDESSEYSPARARALLDLYGYTDRNASELWQRSLNAVGLKIEVDVASWPELLKKSRAGTLMMWGYSWSAGSPEGGFFLGIACGFNASEANDPRFMLPAFDRLFERQRARPDGPEREAVMRQAKNLLVVYMPFKVHLHTMAVDLVQPWTQGFWRHPFMRDIWRFVDPGPQR